MSADSPAGAAAPKSIDRALVRGLFFFHSFAATSVARIAQDVMVAWRHGPL